MINFRPNIEVNGSLVSHLLVAVLTFSLSFKNAASVSFAVSLEKVMPRTLTLSPVQLKESGASVRRFHWPVQKPLDLVVFKVEPDCCE